MKNIWRIEIFSLEPIKTLNVFVKKTYNVENISIICKTRITNIEKDFHAQAYKTVTNQEFHAYDFKTMKDHYLITYGDKYIF